MSISSKSNDIFTFVVVGPKHGLLDSKNTFEKYVENNTIVVSPFQKKRLNSQYILYENDVWSLDGSSNLYNNEIYFNRSQRKSYELEFGSTVKITPYIFLHSDSDKLKSLKISLWSVGSFLFQDLLDNFETIRENIRDCLSGHILNSRQPFNVTCQLNDKSQKFVVFPLCETSHVEIASTCLIDITLYNDQPLGTISNTPIKTWNLYELGVGGMRDVADQLFRRAFASRLHPLATVQKLGVKHVRGVLLYGPPGTGKTLLARSIAGLLNKSRPPKIISGPEIFSKYVGESQKNIRDLFKDAEDEQVSRGDRSDLHVIIFDEFDSIGRKRSSEDSTTGTVGSQIVNQLLVKMDGVEELNNLLIIALTNRRDILDSALLRPGRFEIQIEVKLPNVDERTEIFEIHCSKMILSGGMSPDISMKYLAEKSNNYSGAEIEGVVKSAVSYAMSRGITVNESKIECDQTTDISVTLNDFITAFEEVRPQFGVQQHHLFSNVKNVKNNTLSDEISITEDDNFLTNQLLIQHGGEPFHTMMVHTLDSKIVGEYVKGLGISCLMCIDYFDLIGLSEADKCLHIKQMYQDASKTNEALIIVDKLSTIIGFGDFRSTGVLQTFATLFRYYPHVKTLVITDKPVLGIECYMDFIYNLLPISHM
jgi:AAA+ superfamily predicted ATPase